MLFSREDALDILGLPTFAPRTDIIQRYKVLALMWYPEKHINREFAIEEFCNITLATITLIYPEQNVYRSLSLPRMYGFFQYMFFGSKGKDADYESESDVASEGSNTVEDGDLEKHELQAEDKASELLGDEEREKTKAEKRKAKKKKRKEKKKLEKLGKETSDKKVGTSSNLTSTATLTSSISTSTTASKTTSTETSITEPNATSAATSTAACSVTSTKANKQKKVQETVSSESEEDLDTSSAFVSVIARKHRKVPDIEIKDENFSLPQIPKEDHQSVVLRSRQLALRGNEMANLGYYSEAAELFAEAIKLDPSDHRFYGNRSYCFDRLLLYEKALKDADKAIALSPVWPKGYFRRGRALLGLKKYAEAEQCFVEVMKRDNDCVDAISELRKAKILQIMEKGYSKEHAEAAISNYSTVAEALGSLLTNRVSRVSIKDVDPFISDDDTDISWKCIQKPKPQPQPYDIKMDPNNPEGHNSLWIGNVQSDVTERKLTTMFGKYGELINVKLMPEKFCAFVNYKLKSSPGKAMKAYQNYELSGAKLVIRFPNLPGETPVKKKPAVATQEKLLGPVNGSECYFWRTKGCVHGDQCRYQHIKEHKEKKQK
ncbi:tetratricopeptide repeat protein 31 [Trichonephila inaurata madagascariensis]|uniref:Tetratricopeptide repeat protein 31 n=1 Tax=Trichonephila inaurata madagascariensis TaxID=2747483 RepID=A0A8X6X4Z0_9ARAC|nr:tetratricopeptide repeat protein 31 [Trichonephila inaurata madagascariensis]